MATAESTQASLGPRYAPEDPTLPKPWKGLIDGSTGLLYYWNPETNITQYERPAALAPPLPPGPPPSATTPKLAPIPMARTMAPNGTQSPQPGQQMLQYPLQQIQQQQSSQQLPMQQIGQQMPPPQTQQMPNQHNQQTPHQQVMQYPYMQYQQTPQPQISYMQGHFMPRPQGQQPQGQQIMHQQGQQQPGSQIAHQQAQQPQGQQFGLSRVEDPGHQEGKQVGFTSLQAQQTGGISSNYHMPSVAPQAQMPSVQTQQQIGGPSSVSVQQTGASLVPLQHTAIDTSHGHQKMGGPTIPNHMGPGMVRPPMGLKMEYETDQFGRAGNGVYTSSSKEASLMSPRQPKLAAIPPARNQQDTRMGAINPQFAGPGPSHSGGLNIAPGPAMPNMYNHAAFPNSASIRPPPRTIGSLDVNLSAADVYRQHHEVTAMGDNVPAPFMTFEATGFPPEILREIHFAGFASPTPIQAQTWPVALQSRDIVAIAKTGSGKTLGYLMPAFVHLRRCRNDPQMGPTVLVLAPTRELATQIQDEAIKFGRSSRVSCTCLYGGAPKGPQLREIERGADIVVATPGRLNDILEMKKINFRQVSLLVLDEADRMLDMGFEPQIRKIVNEIPPRRQTLMYTATWPKEVRKIAADLLVNPVQVNIGSVDELAANKSITQYVEVIPPMEKQRRLEQILRSQERGSKIIIFCSTKKLCDQLARSVGRSFGAAAIHGDKSQGERDWVLNQFRSGKAPILVATDVAARGLDIKDIRVVINFDFPTGIEDYVHRIGRTGRAGATGVAYTFFSDQDWKYAADLVKVLEGANQRVPPEVRDMATRGGPTFSKGRGGISRWDSGGGRFDSGGGRGMRDGGGFGGRGGRNDGGRFDGGRNDFFGGRGNRGRGFGGPGGPGGFVRHDRGPPDRYNSMDGRGRFDNRRGIRERIRDRSYSRSPEKVRTWGYDRSRSGSRSRSRSRSYSRSRSWSRSRSRSPSRSRSRSRSRDRYDRPPDRNFIHPPRALVTGFSPPLAPVAPVVSGLDVPLAGQMSPMSPGQDNGSFPRTDLSDQLPVPDGARLSFPVPIVTGLPGAEPSQLQVPDV